jgi:RNA polymerase sigma factor (sigma-70 family)
MKELVNYRFSFNEKSVSMDVEISNKTDFEIWQAFLAGNKSAFINIYETYFDSLFSYGTRITPNQDLVKDSIHDVFFDLRKNSENIGNTNHIKFYLFKCLKARLLKELTGWTGKRGSLDDHTPFEITFSYEEILINSQMDTEQTEKIKKAVEELSPRKREAVYYIFFEGLNYEEVKELMELSSAKSARDLIYKALRDLRNSLGFLPPFFYVMGSHYVTIA